MNPLTTRICAATAALAACGVILTGCGSGQITQTSTQESGVNGMSANINDIALRNVHLQASQDGDYLKPGRTIPLVFVAANNSIDVNDRLLGVTSEVGDVKITGDTVIPANEALIVDAAGEAAAMDSNAPVSTEVTLTQPITNGLSYKFTFEFEKAGKGTIAVPISAAESSGG